MARKKGLGAWMVRGKSANRGVVVNIYYGANKPEIVGRGIVMGYVPSDNFNRAYGREVYVCEFEGRAGQAFKIAHDADVIGKKAEAESIRVVDKRRLFLGEFSTKEDAAHAVDAAAVHYFGIYAFLNFPQEQTPC